MKSEANAMAPAAGGTPVTGRVVLGVSCTIHEAQHLRAQLLAQAELPGPYEIDGSGVQQIDTAGSAARGRVCARLPGTQHFLRLERTLAGARRRDSRAGRGRAARESGAENRHDPRSRPIPRHLLRRELRSARLDGERAAQALGRRRRPGADQHHLPRRAFHQGRRRDFRLHRCCRIHAHAGDVARPAACRQAARRREAGRHPAALVRPDARDAGCDSAQAAHGQGARHRAARRDRTHPGHARRFAGGHGAGNAGDRHRGTRPASAQLTSGRDSQRLAHPFHSGTQTTAPWQ